MPVFSLQAVWCLCPNNPQQFTLPPLTCRSGIWRPCLPFQVCLHLPLLLTHHTALVSSNRPRLCLTQGLAISCALGRGLLNSSFTCWLLLQITATSQWQIKPVSPTHSLESKSEPTSVFFTPLLEIPLLTVSPCLAAGTSKTTQIFMDWFTKTINYWLYSLIHAECYHSQHPHFYHQPLPEFSDSLP